MLKADRTRSKMPGRSSKKVSSMLGSRGRKNFFKDGLITVSLSIRSWRRYLLKKFLSPEKWNAGCLCPSCSVHIPTGSKDMWFSLQGSGIGEPSLYHALVVIFLEFFAWGLLTTPMITVSFSSSCFPFYRMLYTQCLFVYFFRYWMKHFLITLSWWMDWLLASR